VKLVVGLGNPGSEYQGTRHNAGFMVADLLLGRSELPSGFRSGFSGKVARVRLEGVDALLLKPETFMNRSGRSVADTARFYSLAVEDLLVVHDDVDLGFGTVRVKSGGGSGGHRGLESCFAELGTQSFDRVRVGIGRPDPGLEATDHVLATFDQSEHEVLGGILETASDAAVLTLKSGAAVAMNRFNRRAASEGTAETPE